MREHPLVTVLTVAVCGATLWAILAEGHQLSQLRAEHKRLEVANPATNSAPTEMAATQSATPEVPRELLQLRAEVARLSQQQRELTGARSENERLRLQLENRRTNSAAAKSASAGYVRTSETKWLGYNTPENTLQSFLWAIRNHDVEKFLEAFTPETGDRLKEGMLQDTNRTPEQLLGSKELPPAYRVAGRKERDTDYVELEVQIAPDIPAMPFSFQQVGGQWKLQQSP
jgi:hypothetical protein